MNASKHHKSSKEILGHVRPARQFEALQYVYDMCKPLTSKRKWQIICSQRYNNLCTVRSYETPSNIENHSLRQWKSLQDIVRHSMTVKYFGRQRHCKTSEDIVRHSKDNERHSQDIGRHSPAAGSVFNHNSQFPLPSPQQEPPSQDHYMPWSRSYCQTISSQSNLHWK